MDWIVFGIIAAAILYFLWRYARMFIKGKQGSSCRGCSSAAKCCNAKPLAPRKGRETDAPHA